MDIAAASSLLPLYPLVLGLCKASYKPFRRAEGRPACAVAHYALQPVFAGRVRSRSGGVPLWPKAHASGMDKDGADRIQSEEEKEEYKEHE